MPTDALHWSSGIPTLREEAGDRAATRSTLFICLILIFYFSTCDFVLKFFPAAIATALRYLPEGFLYLLFAQRLFKSRLPISTFPLLFPLLFCVFAYVASGFLNGQLALAFTDFRVFFRFTAFAFILWQLQVRSSDWIYFLDRFLILSIFELVVGLFTFAGSTDLREFFSPAVGWNAATAPVQLTSDAQQAFWTAGTLGDYNRFGFFMTLSATFALSTYLSLGNKKYLWVSLACAVGAVISSSRHALILLVVSLLTLGILNRQRFLAFLKPLIAAVVLGSVLVGATLSDGAVSKFFDRFTSSFSPETLAGDNPTENIRLFMLLLLPQRFVATYPIFGQGPIPATEQTVVGEQDQNSGPRLKSAPDLPGWATFYLADVVWLLILGLYGLVGVAALAGLFGTVIVFGRRLSKATSDPPALAVSHAAVASAFVVITAGFFSEEIIARDAIPVFWCVAGLMLANYSRYSSTGVEAAS